MPSSLDPAFGPPSSLPFPAGTSPFRQKGLEFGTVETGDFNVDLKIRWT